MNHQSAAEDRRIAIGHLQAAIHYPHLGWDYSESLRHVTSMIQDYRVAAACDAIRDSAGFAIWPASLSHHHACPNGLIKHTFEVLDITLHMAEKFPSVNRDVLIAACLWHDFGKTWEYSHVETPQEGQRHLKRSDIAGAWVESRHKDRLGHISISAIEFTVAARAAEVPNEIVHAITHCILAHHGPVRDWGSPVAPQSLEAWLLHHADMLSSRYGATK